MVKYIVIGDYDISDDGDSHYVDPEKLIRLYSVNLKECVRFCNWSEYVHGDGNEIESIIS
jgi:hypothetical protein